MARNNIRHPTHYFSEPAVAKAEGSGEGARYSVASEGADYVYFDDLNEAFDHYFEEENPSLADMLIGVKAVVRLGYEPAGSSVDNPLPIKESQQVLVRLTLTATEVRK